MHRRYYVIISILIIVIVLVYYSFTQKFTPASTPPTLYTYSFSVLNQQVTKVAGYSDFLNNVTQGLSLQENLTLTSTTDQSITIPIENLTVTYYNSIVNLNSWINDNGNHSLIQQQAFAYSFSQNQLVLQPHLSNSTILTINLTENAPLGQYSLDILLGNVVGASQPYSENIGLEMIVTPK